MDFRKLLVLATFCFAGTSMAQVTFDEWDDDEDEAPAVAKAAPVAKNAKTAPKQQPEQNIPQENQQNQAPAAPAPIVQETAIPAPAPVPVEESSTTSQIPEKKLRIGAHFAFSYNLLWNIDEKIITNQDSENEFAQTCSYIKGADEFGGIGVSFGADILYMLNSTFSLHGEFLLSYRHREASLNSAFEESIYDAETLERVDSLSTVEFTNLGDMEISTWNIEFPLFIRAYLPNTFFIEAGPWFSFNVSSEASFKNMTDDLDDIICTASFNMGFSAGKSIVIGSNLLDIDFRFILGISSLKADEVGVTALKGMSEITSRTDPKLFSFQLGATYWFF